MGWAWLSIARMPLMYVINAESTGVCAVAAAEPDPIDRKITVGTSVRRMGNDPDEFQNQAAKSRSPTPKQSWGLTP
jgi:hypothetical protein